MHCYIRNSREKSKLNERKTFESPKAHTCSFLKLDVLTGHPIMRCETYFIGCDQLSSLIQFDCFPYERTRFLFSPSSCGVILIIFLI